MSSKTSKKSNSNVPLTFEQISTIVSSYPPLSDSEFRYSAIRKGCYSPNPKDPSILLIQLTKTNKDYSLLSSMTHKCYIKHRISSVSNQAPTIEQWLQELRVYPDELDRSNKTESKRLFDLEPSQNFFTSVNANFASSAHARLKKKRGHFIYYYYIDPTTNQVRHLNEPEARQLYCKKFEQSIIFEKSPAKPVFESLWKLCMSRSRDIPIVLRGYCIQNNLESPTSIADQYHNYNTLFGSTYCIAEMLINYPHLDQCIWNREVAPKIIPKAPKPKPSERPKVTYSNPHADKIYDCDLPEVDLDDAAAFLSDDE